MKKSPKQAKTTKEISTGSGHRIAIEHCTSWSVFKRKANEIFAELSQLIPDVNFELSLNADGKPKRGEHHYIALNKLVQYLITYGF